MQKKYFFFDIDGTLAPGGTLQIPESAERALEGLRRAGHFTAVATGRLQCDAARFAAKHGFDAVVSDGGYSASVDGRLLFMDSLPLDACVRLCAQLDDRNIPWAVCTENQTVRLTRDRRFRDAAGENYFETRIQPSIDPSVFSHIYKVFIACDLEQEQQIDLGELPSVRFSERVLFIEPTHKAEGIRRVMDLLHAPCEDVVVFGDGTNDLQMFDPMWLSIAMGNAAPPLKEAADYVTSAVDEDGVFSACRHFEWI